MESPQKPPAPYLFLLSTLGIGGSEKKIIKVANDLYRRGSNIHLGYLNRPDTLLDELNPAIPVACFDRRGKFSVGAMLRLKKYVTTHGISTIICVNLYPLLYAKAVIYLLRERSLAHVLLVNTTEFLTAKETYQMFLYAPLLRGVNKIVFGCKYHLERWVERYRLLRSRCDYIYNGVDESWYSMAAVPGSQSDLRRLWGLSSQDFVIANVGQLRPEKQHQDLIKAVEKLLGENSGLRAVIAGDGPERMNLERLIQSKQLGDKVFLLGEVRDVRPVLAMTDVFVMTSASETFSNAALEAMSMGKPVVMSNVGGTQEMVTNGHNGYLYKKGNVDELVGILRKLMRDLEIRRRLADNARSSVLEKFTFSRMVDAYERILLELQ